MQNPIIADISGYHNVVDYDYDVDDDYKENRYH